MKKGLLAISPLIVFVTLYLVTSLVARDFYKVPITVAFLFTSVYAIATTRGKLLRRINVFSRGAGTPEMMLMVWIFVLAGAFANTAKVMGMRFPRPESSGTRSLPVTVVTAPDTLNSVNFISA